MELRKKTISHSLFICSKQGAKDIYRIFYMRDKRTRDTRTVRCVNDANQRVLVNNKEIKGRWRSYFEDVLTNYIN